MWGSLQVGHPVRGGRDVVASHVLVHLREALPHVIFSTALPHCAKPEPLGRVVELAGGQQSISRDICLPPIWCANSSSEIFSSWTCLFAHFPAGSFPSRQKEPGKTYQVTKEPGVYSQGLLQMVKTAPITHPERPNVQ